MAFAVTATIGVRIAPEPRFASSTRI